ncbi:putative transcription factor [Arabidopsis thaliana]
MNKKLLNPLEDPPTASSSEDVDEEISSGEDEKEHISNSSSSEEENELKDLSTQTLNSPSTEAPTLDSGSETNSDSDKPIVLTSQKKKEGTDSSGTKRASEGTSSKDIKRAKKVSGDDDNKKADFQSLWTKEDEISLLQGMIDFKAETGTSAHDDMNGFFDIAKRYISFDVSKIQFGDKIRGLKKKYFGVRKKKGLDLDHDKKCLGLAKSIWGLDGKEVVVLGGDSETSNWFEKSFLVRVVARLGVDECIVKWKWSKVSKETKKRIEEKMKMVEAKELELLSQKIDVLTELASVVAETI